MRPASRATRCCRSSCALQMRASLVDAGRLVAHPRTIKEIMHTSPVNRRPIENHTTTNLTAQRKSPAEGLPGRGMLRFRGKVKFRLRGRAFRSLSVYFLRSSSFHFTGSISRKQIERCVISTFQVAESMALQGRVSPVGGPPAIGD